MGSEGFEWKDPQWIASAIGYESRPDDERQAICYLAACYGRRKPISIRGFAARYNWAPKKARRFLSQAGVKIIYSKEREKGKLASGYLVLLPASERNPKTAHLRIITHGHYYFIN